VTSVVFTALFGPTEALLEQEVRQSSQSKFICFTDNPSLTSETWELVLVKPLFEADPRRSQRHIKICGHERLRDFDEWLYIDNTVRLKVPPEQILEHWLEAADWAAISHDHNATLLEEFEANLTLKKDTSERVNEQLSDYYSLNKSILQNRPVWNGMFARRNTEAVLAASKLWFYHVLRYSARDQLSVLVALDQFPGIRFKRFAERVRSSQWHDWPHRQNESPESKKLRHARKSGLKDTLEQIHDLEREIETMSRQIDALELRNRKLEDRQFLGLRGLYRSIVVLRRRMALERRRARKRKEP
jgi:hypothetical protein